MNNPIVVFDEPELEFRYGQRVIDPRDGLSLFGPYDTDSPTHPKTISYITIGTKDGITKYSQWVSIINNPAVSAPKDRTQIWPPYPGFEAAFNSEFAPNPLYSHEVDLKKLHEASIQRNANERAYQVVDLYLSGLEKLKMMDEKIGVVICIVPDEVWLNCRPKSHVTNPIGVRISSKELAKRRSGQLGLIEDYDPEQYLLSPDFRRQIKARAMEYDVPIQIIRESTLKIDNNYAFGERRLTPLSDRMWNLNSTIYYKCGGKPWKLVSAREGVCYIGICFRLTGEGNTACCAAQMFLNTGDGVVFLGEFGPWFSPYDKQFHLTKTAARDLLKGVLDTYMKLEGKQLTEIFLHSRSAISQEEFDGYKEACPDNVKLVGIRVRPDKYGPRLYRNGEMPVIRGTFWELNDRCGLLWGTGFKERIATYDGWEIPVPLRIDIQHGEASIQRVAQDIYGLTKLNYNACKLGDSGPVTVGFSDAVGEILISNQTVATRKPQFKFYI